MAPQCLVPLAIVRPGASCHRGQQLDELILWTVPKGTVKLAGRRLDQGSEIKSWVCGSRRLP